MFTAGTSGLARLTTQKLKDGLIVFFSKGPISESDFFTWEALICGPKDTPFVRVQFLCSLMELYLKISGRPGRRYICRPADICEF
jgi:hypothetical protein